MNSEIRKLLEEARSLAAALPEFAGIDMVRALNNILGGPAAPHPVAEKPSDHNARSPTPFLRALPTWGRDPDTAA